MSMSSCFVRLYDDAPPVRREEILRYAGVRGEVTALEPLLSECLVEAENALSYAVSYREFPIVRTEKGLDLGFCVSDARTAEKALSGCDSLVVFAATVGLPLDRLILRAAATSPTKALLLQAIGAERIESLCDTFCRELAGEMGEYFLRPRFSPGYGDLPLSMQREIVSVLDTARQIGLTLNDSLMLSPTKSVTAILGREKRNQ